MAGQGGAPRRKKTKGKGKGGGDGGGKFCIPRTRRQFQLCLRRMSLRFFDLLFHLADRAMYLLGPLLIALASAIIAGLTYVYFRVVLPMLAGTNWVVTEGDREEYWRGRGYDDVAGAGGAEGEGGGDESDGGGAHRVPAGTPALLALTTPGGVGHTLLVAFFLANIVYNYCRCVSTSNGGPRYDAVVRELARATGFDYPETDEELARCRKEFERKIYEKAKRRRDEMMAARGEGANGGGAGPAAPAPAPAPDESGTTAAANGCRNGDEESQTPRPSPLMATSTTNPSATSHSSPLTTNATNTPPTASTAPAASPAPPLPRIHHWQLLSPVEWGHCRYSSRPKPPRAHYDHVTKSLVLNMDHYCPWMFNCVGYFNYRYFFNFLWFVTTALWYGAYICFPAFMNLGTPRYREQVRASGGWRRSLRESLKGVVVRHYREDPWIPTPDERTAVALGFMLCLCLAAAVLCLGGFHLYLLLSAQTTIEFHGNWSRRRNKGWRNPYSAGSWRRNWEMVYGTRRRRSLRGRDPDGDDDGADEERYRYRGCWGVLTAMMPSSREPEFLPFPIDGKLVRRKNLDGGVDEDGSSEEEWDLEMALPGTASEGAELPVSTEEREFLMEPKDVNSRGQLVDRTKANKTSKPRIV